MAMRIARRRSLRPLTIPRRRQDTDVTDVAQAGPSADSDCWEDVEIWEAKWSSANTSEVQLNCSSVLDAAGWITTSDLHRPVESALAWCQTKVSEAWNATQQVLFPSTRYKRDLDDAMSRVEQLEIELQGLKKQKLDHEVVSAKPDHQYCEKCAGHLAGHLPQAACVGAAPPPPPPPPPPPKAAPPPPPPPPPPGKLNSSKKPVIKKSKKAEKPAAASLPSISLDDIKKVKLKKRSPAKTATPGTPEGKLRTPLITLDALRSVTLKSSEKKRRSVGRRASKENGGGGDFRSGLKRSRVDRSPGGTPLKRNVEECGEGLTPTMTRALKKKFENTKTPSPRDLTSTSPTDDGFQDFDDIPTPTTRRSDARRSGGKPRRRSHSLLRRSIGRQSPGKLVAAGAKGGDGDASARWSVAPDSLNQVAPDM
ncbi:PREDICTED: proline-rich protein 11-like [Priapulus caudatus]|uniref:Proline-rich protein 11-like n=1 Tax=Priapulus caudatus TaxID=37621 RepID=A0ABM1ER69_PRICU|nr:PREDICTED: proline-rich protein 11-like [Priapulus caudatus]XP_014674690.1 PREDICTED: proline-rich protein 11-like [Priapulus caudatus]